MRISLAVYYWSYPALLILITALLARLLYLAGSGLSKGSPVEVSPVELWIGRLLIAGLVIVSAGYLGITLLTQEYVSSRAQMVDMETMKLGFGLMILGVLFSFDLLVLAVLKRGGWKRMARSSELI